jgi:hypothetical protein
MIVGGVIWTKYRKKDGGYKPKVKDGRKGRLLKRMIELSRLLL